MLFSTLVVSQLAATSACIVPVPLEAEPAATNSPPRIIFEELEPQSGTELVHRAGDVFGFNIVAEDVDLEDQLTAALLRAGVKVDDALLPSSGDATNPARRSGSIPPRDYCFVLSVSGSEIFTVLVSDRAIDNFGMSASPVAQASWVLTCR